MKNLLLTGGTGFLGQNLQPLLSQTYEVQTLGRSAGNTIRADLVEETPELGSRFDIVLHAAGKAHLIPHTVVEAEAFFAVNEEGTKNLCRALESSGLPEVLIFVSSVAVYGCTEGENIDERHPLCGTDPYALSKIRAEAFLTEWCAARGVRLGILRPALMAGAGAKGTLGAMVDGIRRSFYFDVGRGEARKSVLMAEDIARLLPALAQKGGTYNLCDLRNPSLRELSTHIAAAMGRPVPCCIPYSLAKVLAAFGNHLGPRTPFSTVRLQKMTSSLTFSSEKARRELEWEPLDVLGNYRI